MSVLAVNGGSSSLKLALFDADGKRRFSQTIERIGSGGPADHASAITTALDALEEKGESWSAAGHRFVHGGPRLDQAQRLTAEALDELKRVAAIDPTHLPAELALVDAISRRHPSLPQVVCFDTAFHRNMPRVAKLLPIPRRYEAAGIRRYGFHGLSYAYLMKQLERLGAANGRILLAHLGSGASLAAVLDGQSVDTTMSFTPASGVVMGTRSGDLDPGLLVHLLRTEKLSADALDDLINRRSGLAGVSEIGSDMRDLLAKESSDVRAAEAIALFCYSVKKAIGALAAVLGGVDTLVFAGGIGEKSAPIRARVGERLAHLGIAIDTVANQEGRAVVSAAGSRCTVRVIPTDEESMIAEETLAILKET